MTPRRRALDWTLNGVTCALLSCIGLAAACVQHPLATPGPALMVAHFTARSPHNGESPPRNGCWMSGDVEGDALLRDGELSLSIRRGWLAVTRDNDKQWDDLHLLAELTRHPLSDTSWVPLAQSIPVVLGPTVDSAGPQLTTWQLHDTLRVHTMDAGDRATVAFLLLRLPDAELQG